MKTAPFDLEKALAGHPLVTRSGVPVTGFRLRVGEDREMYGLPYEANVGTDALWHTYSPDGTWLPKADGGVEHGLDLFLLLPDDEQPDSGRILLQAIEICAASQVPGSLETIRGLVVVLRSLRKGGTD